MTRLCSRKLLPGRFCPDATCCYLQTHFLTGRCLQHAACSRPAQVENAHTSNQLGLQHTSCHTCTCSAHNVLVAPLTHSCPVLLPCSPSQTPRDGYNEIKPWELVGRCRAKLGPSNSTTPLRHTLHGNCPCFAPLKRLYREAASFHGAMLLLLLHLLAGGRQGLAPACALCAGAEGAGQVGDGAGADVLCGCGLDQELALHPATAAIKATYKPQHEHRHRHAHNRVGCQRPLCLSYRQASRLQPLCSNPATGCHQSSAMIAAPYNQPVALYTM